jgi:hypothetical protein
LRLEQIEGKLLDFKLVDIAAKTTEYVLTPLKIIHNYSFNCKPWLSPFLIDPTAKDPQD